jgi:hypothetical protein
MKGKEDVLFFSFWAFSGRKSRFKSMPCASELKASPFGCD